MTVLRSRRTNERPRNWLERVEGALDACATLDEDAFRTLVVAINGPLADEQRHIEEDPKAFVEFWRRLAERFPDDPRFRARYADTLLLVGRTPEAREELLRALDADSRLLYSMGGDWGDVMERAGGRDWAAWRAHVIRAAEFSDPEDNREYMEEKLQELLPDIANDPELRTVVRSILGERKDPTTGAA